MTDLITKIESYDFKDPLGHPLVNCVEWIEIKRALIEGVINPVNIWEKEFKKTDNDNIY